MDQGFAGQAVGPAGQIDVPLGSGEVAWREHRPSTGRQSAVIPTDDHGDQRTSRRPGFGQRAPFEHRNVHMRPTKDLVDRMCAGQRPATGAPPGTRTPNPRIKSPNPAMPARSSACRLMSFPHARGGSHGAVVCRLVSVTCAATEHRWSTATDSRCSIGVRGGGAVQRSKQRTFDPLAVDHAPSGGGIGRLRTGAAENQPEPWHQ